MNRDTAFTFADGSHEGYPANGGPGKLSLTDTYGTVWEIHYDAEHFRCYRRWITEPVEGVVVESSYADSFAGDVGAEGASPACDDHLSIGHEEDLT